jgi:dephospho-CoA kinase
MLVIGLTGSIGMGKSTAAARFRELGIPVCDADAEVHRLYEGDAAAPIEAAFPGTTREGRVDRARLSAALLGDPESFARLEAIVHPLVQAAEREFLRRAARAGSAMAVLEVPLLFETGGDKRCDVTIVVSAPADVQRQRVLERPGMTVEKLDSILNRQLGDAEKRARADFIVDTGRTIQHCRAEVDRIVAALAGRTGTAYARCWR